MFIRTEFKLVYHLNEIIRKELIGDFTLCIFLLNISLFLIYYLLFSVEWVSIFQNQPRLHVISCITTQHYITCTLTERYIQDNNLKMS